MPPATRVLLIRHAESQPDPALPEAAWPLSKAGSRQAHELAARLEDAGVEAVFSSPYRRAVETVEPFAKKSGLKIELRDDLRERHLVSGFYPQWRQLIEEAWRDLSFKLPDCESGLECQARVKACVDSLACQNQGRTIAVSSHGNALALYLTLLNPEFGFAGWSAMRNPDMFVIEYRDGEPRRIE